MQVIDKNGQRVLRSNGILQDGDRMHVVGIHDSRTADIERGFAAAALAAQKLKRIENFDKKAILAEADKLPLFQKAVFKEARSRMNVDEALHFAKAVRTTVVPATVSDKRCAEIFNLSPEGYQEFEAARKRGASDDDALTAAKGINVPNGSPYVVADAGQVRDAYQDRLVNAWKSPATATLDQELPHPSSSLAPAPISGDDVIAARDQRISKAWMRP